MNSTVFLEGMNIELSKVRASREADEAWTFHINAIMSEDPSASVVHTLAFLFFFYYITLHCVIIISANLFFTIIMGVSLSYVVVLCWNTFGRCCVPPVAQLIGNTSCVKYYCNQYVTWTFVRHIGHIFHWILEEYGKDH